MNGDRILLVEDDKEIREGVEIFLKSQGYAVFQAADGVEGLKVLEEREIDLAIVDVMMPRMDGITMTAKLREKYDFPVIFLSAKSEEVDKILGLNMGADDYITKPFNILELKARIKAILRRSVKKAPAETQEKKVLKARDLELSFDSRRVFISGKEVNLTAKEFDLLELLMENPGKVYSREKLLDTVWGYDYPGDVRTVDVHVRRLREKIEVNPSEPKYIFTKWGVGYYFN